MAAPRQYLFAVLTLLCVVCYVSAQKKKVVAPELSTKNTVIYTDIGEKVVMDCTLEAGAQSTKRFWKKDGVATRTVKRYKLKKQNSLLVINKMREEDEGEFSCKAKNKAGTDEIKVQVVIRVPLYVTINPEGPLMAYKDSSLTLTCSSPGAPAPKFTWHFDDRELSADERVKIQTSDSSGQYYSSITIDPVSHLDIGKFTCTARQEGDAMLINVNVDVKFAPEITAEPTEPVYWWQGEQVTLTCEVKANERASVVWFHENGNFEKNQVSASNEWEGDDHITVTSLLQLSDVSEIGSYECEATNSEGQVSYMFQVREAIVPVVLDVRPVSAEESVLKVRVMMSAGRPETEEVRVGYMIEGDRESEQFDSSCELDDMNQCEVSLTNVQQYNYYVLSAIGRNMAGWGPLVDDFTPVYVGGSDLEWTYEYKTTVPPTTPTTDLPTTEEAAMSTTDDMDPQVFHVEDSDPIFVESTTSDSEDDAMTTMSYPEPDPTEDEESMTTMEDDQDEMDTTKDMMDATTVKYMPIQPEVQPTYRARSSDGMQKGSEDSEDMESEENMSEDEEDVTMGSVPEAETTEDPSSVTYELMQQNSRENSGVMLTVNFLVVLASVLCSVHLLLSL